MWWIGFDVHNMAVYWHPLGGWIRLVKSFYNNYIITYCIFEIDLKS